MHRLFVLSILLLAMAATFAQSKDTFDDCNHRNSDITISSKYSSEDNVMEITVYTLTRVGNYGCAAKSHRGYYNSDTNELTVGKLTFSVTHNRAYGQDKDYRSEYRYVAGDYYFNL